VAGAARHRRAMNHEHSGVDDLAVASNPANGPLIAALFDGELMVKEGSLTANWNHEHNGAQQIAVASDAVNGPLIGILNSDDQLLVKERSLTANWNNEHNDVLIISLAG
jgi:hypothetical protein